MRSFTRILGFSLITTINLVGFGAGCGTQESAVVEQAPALEQTSVAGPLQAISSDKTDSELKSPGSDFVIPKSNIKDAKAEVQTVEDVQGSHASGLKLDVISNAPDPVAAQPNDLCRTNSAAILYTSPTSGIYVPQNALVRILDYKGPSHYLARYAGTVGQLERSRVSQETCY